MKEKILLLSALLLFPFAALAQQSLPPATTPYYDFTQGVQINGSWGNTGDCLVSTGAGSQWTTCGGGGSGIPGLTSDGNNGAILVGKFQGSVIQDTYSLEIPASAMSGADPCEKISNAFGIIRSLRSGTVNACNLAMAGAITCSSDPFASIQTAYTDFGGVLKTCQANIVPATTLPGGASGNTLLPWKIPGGIRFDGGNSHPLPSPTYPAPRGTTFQPAPPQTGQPPYKGPIIALGGYKPVFNNFNPMGVKPSNFAVSCLAAGTSYVTTTVNITDWAITGSGYPYTAVFTYSGAANQVAQWDVLSLAGFPTTTAFNGPYGKHMVVTAVTANTFTVLINVLPGSATEAGTAIVSMGTTGIINLDAQEGSGPDTFSVSGCTTAYAVDVDPQNGIGGVQVSGFDSAGAHGGMITMPADPSAVCFKIGGTAEGQLISFPANIESITGNSCQGTLTGGVATGTFAVVEGQNVYFGLNRMAYLDGLIHAGFIKSTNTVTFVNTVDSFSNTSYPWTNLFWFGPKFGHTLNIMGGGGLGTARPIGSGDAVTLFDFNYPTGPCTLLASNEGSIGFYSRGIGGGGNGVVLSTARTGCVSTPPANMASTATGNTFTAIQNFLNTIHMGPLNTATPSTNYGSPSLALDVSYSDGTNPHTLTMTLTCAPGAGATPNFTCNLAPPTSAPAFRVLTFTGAAPWDIWETGVAGTATTYRWRGPMQMFNSAGTFHADFAQPTLTGTRTITLQDASGTMPLLIAKGNGVALGTGAITTGTCATAVVATATGAVNTDSLAWAFNAAPPANYASLTVHAYVANAGGQVGFVVCNPTAGSITPSAASVNWSITR